MSAINAEEKRMWLEDWKSSGLSAWKYAKTNGLNCQTFTNWVKAAEGKTAAETGATELVEVTAKMSAAKESGGILIEYKGIKVKLPLHAGLEIFRMAVRGLRTAV
jgi:hypothetical protein